ncbi:MAG TPA: DUF2203 domain-containing protein [Candidatus Dormibacteraeota bacterium]|nr:DUF2203 domain-containing protein [Candidatus Dormibacteraeota bacterium]
MAHRLYTVDEANRVLPEVSRLVERIVDLAPILPEMQETVRINELKFHRPTAGEPEREKLAASVAELRAAEMAVAVALRSLESMDVVLKDPMTGLVDFHCQRQGEVVELCWQLGEARVASWHRIGEGFQGRKPL